jgi:PAS domain S-box-containing protein
MTTSFLLTDHPPTQVKRDSEALLAAVIAFSRDAIISASPTGVIQTWNDGAQRLLGWSAQDAVGRPMLALIADPARSGACKLLQRAMNGEQFQMELEALDHHGESVEVSVGAAPVHDREGAIIALSFIIRDLRRRRRSQANDALLASLVRQSRDSIFSVTREGLISTWNPASEKLYGYTCDEAINRPIGLLMPDNKREESQTMLTAVLGGEMVFLETRRQRKDGVQVDVAISGAPLRDVHGDIIGISAIHRDITPQRQHEEQMRLVMRELAHRSKNLLAIILSMAAQTARNSPALPEFNTRFTQRLQGLAHSHDLLIQQNWRGAPIRELIKSHLEPFMEQDRTRVRLKGPEVVVDPKAAQNLGLSLHELATNASKYGALSGAAGHVDITWSATPEGLFALEWRECGGPRVKTHKGKGFGQTVLERLTAQALEGKASLSFASEGVIWRIEIPADYLVDGGDWRPA